MDLLLSEQKYESLRTHVGLNIDIAHMRMARIKPQQPIKFKKYFVNAHICDHPNIHTRDQKIGSWTPIDRIEGDDYGYLAILADSLHERKSLPPSDLPHSGSIGLELEGCNRISWIHESLTSMKQTLQTVQNHRSEIKKVHGV